MKLHYTNVFNDMNGHKSSTVYNKSFETHTESKPGDQHDILHHS